LYASHSSDQIKEDEMGVARSTHREMRYALRILVGKPGRKRPFGRLRLRWKEARIFLSVGLFEGRYR